MLLVNKEREKLLEFINRKDLYKIDDNKDVIDNIMSNNREFLEYEYRYTYTTFIPTGKSMIPIVNTGYGWTTDKNRNLTGDVRLFHYKYYGYKVVNMIVFMMFQKILII